MHTLKMITKTTQKHPVTTVHKIREIYAEHSSQNQFFSDPPGLYQAVDYILSLKGKQIRPTLLLMACDMFGGQLKNALNPAFGIEVFHNSTLVHDDIMDEAEIRRGKPAVHKVFGTDKAILAGDVMIFYALKYLHETEEQFILPIMRLFNKTAIEVFEGQQLDMCFEKRERISIDEYLQMIRNKTAVLLAASLQIGAIAGDASLSDQNAIYQFGLNLGMAFQLQDDYLDAFGDEKKFGKCIGGDIVNNKKTWLQLSAIEQANVFQQVQLRKLLASPNDQEKVNGVIALYRELGVKAQCEEKIADFYQQSLDSLERIKLPEERKIPMLRIAQAIFSRDC